MSNLLTHSPEAFNDASKLNNGPSGVFVLSPLYFAQRLMRCEILSQLMRLSSGWQSSEALSERLRILSIILLPRRHLWLCQDLSSHFDPEETKLS